MSLVLVFSALLMAFPGPQPEGEGTPVESNAPLPSDLEYGSIQTGFSQLKPFHFTRPDLNPFPVLDKLCPVIQNRPDKEPLAYEGQVRGFTYFVSQEEETSGTPVHLDSLAETLEIFLSTLELFGD